MSETTTLERKTWDVKEAAAMAGLAEHEVKRLITAGLMPGRHLTTRTTLIPRSAFARWLESRHARPPFQLAPDLSTDLDRVEAPATQREVRDAYRRDRDVRPVSEGRLAGYGVYFVQCNGEDGPIKIGWSWQVRDRIKDLQCANPYPLRLLNVRPGHRFMEVELHRLLASYRISNEWFHPTDPVLDEVYR